MDWKRELNGMFGAENVRLSRAQKEDMEFRAFLDNTVMPAYAKVVEELTKYNREVVTRNTGVAASLSVRNEGTEEITFQVLKRSLPSGFIPFAEVRAKERKGLRVQKTETSLREGTFTLNDVTQDDVLEAFMKCYRAVFEK